MNKVILKGRLTANPELRKTQSDISVCNFLSLADEIDTIFLDNDEMITLTKSKPVFLFFDQKSCKIFLDVYLHEDNQEIIQSYNRIFESITGNNLVISLRDFRGMICRLPWEQMWTANRGKMGGKDFE